VTKVPLYARAGIRQVWLVDLEQGYVEEYGSPSPEGYRETRRVGPGEVLSPESLGAASIKFEEILP
jgi:Uma2 family endonuclease